MGARDDAVRILAAYFLINGYVRGPIPERLLREGWQVYHKGWEMRISLPADDDVVGAVRALIDEAGLRLARPFFKHGRVIQPIYDREQVLRVLRAAEIDTTGM